MRVSKEFIEVIKKCHCMQREALAKGQEMHVDTIDRGKDSDGNDKGFMLVVFIPTTDRHAHMTQYFLDGDLYGADEKLKELAKLRK